jgi:hypothetical protein
MGRVFKKYPAFFISKVKMSEHGEKKSVCMGKNNVW